MYIYIVFGINFRQTLDKLQKTSDGFRINFGKSHVILILVCDSFKVLCVSPVDSLVRKAGNSG